MATDLEIALLANQKLTDENKNLASAAEYWKERADEARALYAVPRELRDTVKFLESEVSDLKGVVGCQEDIVLMLRAELVRLEDKHAASVREAAEHRMRAVEAMNGWSECILKHRGQDWRDYKMAHEAFSLAT